MKIPAIKKLVEENEIGILKKAEGDLIDGNQLEIEAEGEDEGEQLTHILAAIWIKEEMEKGSDFKTALRAYSQRVRKSISDQ